MKKIRNRFYAPFSGYAKAPTEHGICRGLAGNIFFYSILTASASLVRSCAALAFSGSSMV